MGIRHSLIWVVLATAILLANFGCGGGGATTTPVNLTSSNHHSVSASPPAGAFKTDLIAAAGQGWPATGYDAGNAYLWIEAGYLHFFLETENGWYFADDPSNIKIYASATRPTSTIPGGFPYKYSAPYLDESYGARIAPCGSLDGLFVMVHADLEHLVLIGGGGGGGYSGYSFTYGLYVGDKDVPCGDVKLTIEGDNLVVTFTSASPWWLHETHVYIGTAVPPFSPGLWQYKHSPILPEGQTEDKHYIPLSSIPGGPGDMLYMAFHATIRNAAGAGESATAWNPNDRIRFIVNRRTHWKSYVRWYYPYPENDGEWIKEGETAWGLDYDGDGVSKNEPGWFETFFNDFRKPWGWVCKYPTI